MRHYSYLTLAAVHAALSYYCDHREEIDMESLEETGVQMPGANHAPQHPSLVRLKLAVGSNHSIATEVSPEAKKLADASGGARSWPAVQNS